MRFQAIEEKDWRLIQSGSHNIRKIKERAGRIVDRLIDYWNDKQNGGVNGLLFDKPKATANAGILADVTSHFGSGRLRFGWSRTTGGDGLPDLCGLIVLDRSTVDSGDVPLWEPVLSLTVPAHCDPYWGSEDAKVPFELNSRGDAGFPYFAAGCAIQYAIIFGGTPA